MRAIYANETPEGRQLLIDKVSEVGFLGVDSNTLQPVAYPEEQLVVDEKGRLRKEVVWECPNVEGEFLLCEVRGCSYVAINNGMCGFGLLCDDHIKEQMAGVIGDEMDGGGGSLDSK